MLANLEDGVGKQHARPVVAVREVEEREGDVGAQAAIGARWTSVLENGITRTNGKERLHKVCDFGHKLGLALL